MIRRLVRIFLALSAIVFIAAAVLWVRTWFVSDLIHVGRWDAAGGRYDAADVWIEADYARIELSRTIPLDEGLPAANREAAEFLGVRVRHETSPPARIGFDSWAWSNHYVHRPSASASQEVRLIRVRPWLVVLILGIPPGVWTLNWLRHRRRRRDARLRGLCVACGYDLRATPGRCPECGAEPDPARNTPGVAN